MNLFIRATRWFARITAFDRLRQDLAYAVRGLRRSPGFTATVVVTFALGIGANAAIFSILDLVYLKPPAGVVKPDQIFRVYTSQAPPRGWGRPGERWVTEGGGLDYGHEFSEAIVPKIAPLASVAPMCENGFRSRCPLKFRDQL